MRSPREVREIQNFPTIKRILGRYKKGDKLIKPDIFYFNSRGTTKNDIMQKHVPILHKAYFVSRFKAF